jgi:hypothetical protein
MRVRIGKSVMALACVAMIAALAGRASADPWSFGVMGDTQWSGSDSTGNNINSVAVNQTKACNSAFVAAGVDFVIQVGDLTDTGTTAGLQTRLDCNAALTAADIAFYGLRGNHEDNSASKTFFQANYIPSTTPSATVALAPDGISYSVTHNGTKVVLLDILTADSTAAMNSATTWMSGQLSAADHTQAFVFQHKNLLGQNHKDNAFGSNNDANPTQQNNFYAALQDNGVRYNISGHDHIHYRGEVTSPDGASKVQEIICASDSYKYYTPSTPSSSRDMPVAEQLYETGYYIYTVDGPRVTGQYYHCTPLANGDVPANPVWKLGETFGYSLNGREFTVPQGASYTAVQDTSALAGGTTTAKILSGTNGSTVKEYLGRATTKLVDTGWTAKADAPNNAGLYSDALTLWGMTDVDRSTTDTFILQMSYDASVSAAELTSGSFGLETLTGGNWTPAGSHDLGDHPYNAAETYALGDCGFDSSTHTVWAVVNHDGQFAAGARAVPEPGTIILFGIGALAAAAFLRRKA